MNMRLVVRTNDPYAGTLNHKNLKFFVDGTAGPFRVTSQSDSTTWQVGAEKTVIWDVSKLSIQAVILDVRMKDSVCQ